MYTQCPECLSVFSLDAQTLAKAHGHVVCGHCQASFDSIATLTDQLPAEPFVELSLNEQAYEPPPLDLVVYRPRPEPPAVVASDEPIDASRAASEDFAQLVFTPRFARNTSAKVDTPVRPRRLRETTERRWPWVLVCAALTLLLLAQLGWAERDALIRNPTTGIWLRRTCAKLRCELPLVSAPTRFQLVASNVQAHPTVAGALMISARIRNNAAFAQSWPVLKITLSNAQGQRVAMRRLQPDEYLDDHTILQRGVAAGASAVVLLEVEDPGDKAVAFEFGFE